MPERHPLPTDAFLREQTARLELHEVEDMAEEQREVIARSKAGGQDFLFASDRLRELDEAAEKLRARVEDRGSA
jgi:hypothetical protein